MGFNPHPAVRPDAALHLARRSWLLLVSIPTRRLGRMLPDLTFRPDIFPQVSIPTRRLGRMLLPYRL